MSQIQTLRHLLSLCIEQTIERLWRTLEIEAGLKEIK